MREIVTVGGSIRPKSMSSFKKELASVSKNGPSTKVHMQAEAEQRSSSETDLQLCQDISTLQIVDFPWTNGAVLTELIHTPSASQFSVPLIVSDDASHLEKNAAQQVLESWSSSMKISAKNCPDRKKLQTEKRSKDKTKSLKSKSDDPEPDPCDPADLTNQQPHSHQVCIKRKGYCSLECMSSSDEDVEHAKSEVQYSKLQTAVESKKGFLPKFSFGKFKATANPDTSSVESRQQRAKEFTSKITLEQPGKTTDFYMEQREIPSATYQKRGILGIGGQLRKSLFRKRTGRLGEKDKEGPLEQIRSDDDVDSQDEEVLAFAPASQILESKKSAASPTVSDVPTGELKAKLLTPERILKKPTKEILVSQHEIESNGPMWYIKSAKELSRGFSSTLVHTSKTSHDSVPNELYLEEEKTTKADNNKIKSEEHPRRKDKKKVQDVLYKRKNKTQDASVEAQHALEVLRQVEGLNKYDAHSSQDDDSGLRQYFEKVLPSTVEEIKKANALAGAFQWFRRGDKTKGGPKPEIVIELATAPKTSDVSVQFPEAADEQIQKSINFSQALKMQDSESKWSISRATAASQELLWKIPEKEQPVSNITTEITATGEDSVEKLQAELVYRCTSANEKFPVAQATLPSVDDYVSGDSLLTLSSLDVNEHKSEGPATGSAECGSNLKPPKIPIFSGCCPAPNKTVDLGIPYGLTKDNSNGIIWKFL
ncbi:uncharacterized protein LOC111265904 isoform X2 [Varroa jacobsoni]|uniref:uncharacterized protein LOC111265904 isoform X2 n=1 Tax=Varroa jacobsoni TaxID=62625 RepID=UPI000BF43E1A|nr:uncharacterized protein LOC111265904 isoform X2 [Varroa jacobsoni]